MLDAAAALVAERGRQASLAEICARSGVSRQTIYNHYGDKSGLFQAVAALSMERCPTCPERTGEPPEAVLAEYAAVLLRWAYEPSQTTALRARCRGLVAGNSKATGIREPAMRCLADYLRRESAGGQLSVREPRSAAGLFLDLVLAGPQLKIALGLDEPPSRGPGRPFAPLRPPVRPRLRGSRVVDPPRPPPRSLGSAPDMTSSPAP